MISIEKLLRDANIPCIVTLQSGYVIHVGDAFPLFSMKFNSDKVLREPLTDLSLGEAYINGEIEIDGDVVSVLELRKHLPINDSITVLLRFLNNLLLKSAGSANQEAVATHYNYGDKLYLTFIDTDYRFYSHCVFPSDNCTLEYAAKFKLETIASALYLKPGMRLLDIGAGWGAMQQYFGSRGIHVTSLTLAPDSYEYTKSLIERLGLKNCSVHIGDFLAHEPEALYDAVVICGVIEHIPYYTKFCSKLWSVLKPNGRLYMDASAAIEKYSVSDFTRKYIWTGAHSFMCLQDIIRELLYHGMEIEEVKRETHDYELTMKHWATRLEANKYQIIRDYGEKMYRIFRVYLWAGYHALHENTLQAYHIVAQKHSSPGLRPGLLKRIHQFVLGLR